MLTLSINDLSMMKNELYEAYTDIFSNSLNNLRRTIRIKLKAIRYSNKFINSDPADQLTKSMTIYFQDQKTKKDQTTADAFTKNF